MPLSIRRREPRRAPDTEMTAAYAQTMNASIEKKRAEVRPCLLSVNY